MWFLNAHTLVLGVLLRNGGSFEDDLSLGAEGMFVEELYLYVVLVILRNEVRTVRSRALRDTFKGLDSGSHSLP